MKRLVILFLVGMFIFGGIGNVFCPKEAESLPKKEYFNFVNQDQLLKDYFSALQRGDKEEILKYTGGKYTNFVKEGKLDVVISKIKMFGKQTLFGSPRLKEANDEEGVVTYNILVIYEKVHTLNVIWVKEFGKEVKIVGHSIDVFIPRNK